MQVLTYARQSMQVRDGSRSHRAHRQADNPVHKWRRSVRGIKGIKGRIAKQSYIETLQRDIGLDHTRNHGREHVERESKNIEESCIRELDLRMTYERERARTYRVP